MRMTGNWQPIWLQIQVRWSSNFRLLREFQSIFDLNAKVPDSAFQLGVSWEQMHSTNVFRTTIDQRCFGAADRVGAMGR